MGVGRDGDRDGGEEKERKGKERKGRGQKGGRVRYGLHSES